MKITEKQFKNEMYIGYAAQGLSLIDWGIDLIDVLLMDNLIREELQKEENKKIGKAKIKWW